MLMPNRSGAHRESACRATHSETAPGRRKGGELRRLFDWTAEATPRDGMTETMRQRPAQIVSQAKCNGWLMVPGSQGTKRQSGLGLLPKNTGRVSFRVDFWAAGESQACMGGMLSSKRGWAGDEVIPIKTKPLFADLDQLII